MGACHSSSKLKMKHILSASSKPLTFLSIDKEKINLSNQNLVAPPNQNLVAPPEMAPFQPEIFNMDDFSPESKMPDFDETFEMMPLKKKVGLKQSCLQVDGDKDHRVLELVFTYKKMFDFKITVRQELEITRWQWELLNIMIGPNDSLIYKVLCKKSGTRANLQIIELESENESQIAEMAYQIFLSDKIKNTLEKMLIDDAHIERKKKDSSEMREFLHDPPILQIMDYYIYQEAFQHTLRPKKWLHIVWEEWDTNLKQIMDSRIMNKKYYLDDELVYIAKSLLYALSVLKNAKIAHRNLNPKNIYYVNSTKKYKIGNFRQAKVTNAHKLAAQFKSPSSPMRNEENVSRENRRTEFFTKKFVTKTINHRDLAEYNKFDHSVVGTPYYMDPTLKAAYQENLESVRLLDGLFYSDLFAFALSMFELESLKKYKNFEALVEENLGTKYGVYSLKAILLKILNAKVNLENVVQKAHSKIGTIMGKTMTSPTKSEHANFDEKTSILLNSSKFERLKKKKNFLLAGQIFGKKTEEISREKESQTFRDYDKNKKGNINILLGYMRKITHQIIDENEFLKNKLTEILETEGGIEKHNILFKFYVEIGDNQKALEELLQTKEYLEKNNEENGFDRELELAEKTFEISRMHMVMGKYGTALSFLDDVREMIKPFQMTDKIIDLKKKMSTLRMLIYKNKGDFNLSLKAAQRLIRFIEKYDKSRSIYDLALTKEFIAELYFLLDENSEAMTNIQMALSYYRDIELTQYTSMQLADALIFASQIYKCLLEVENSEAFLTEALVIYSSKYGESHPVIGYILLQLSQIYKDKANYSKAISNGAKALRIMRIYYMEEEDNVIEAVKNLSLIYKEAEDIHKSINLLKESLDVIEKNKTLEKTCLLADNMYNLGICYMEVNDCANARKYFLEALSIYNSNLVEDDLILNDILQKITIVNYEMTKTSKYTVESYLFPDEQNCKNSVINKNRATIARYEEGNLVNSSINLADILMMQGEFEKSLKLYLQALKIKKDSNYNDSKMNDILMKIGLIYLIAGKYDESLKHFQDCLKFICDISSDQLTEHIMRLNLIISHIFVILDQKSQAQEHNEKAGKILTHLRNSSKSLIKDQILMNQAQQFVAIDFNKDKSLDKNEILNDLMEILQIAFHYEESEINKLDSAQKMSLITSIHQAQGEIFSRKVIENSAQNLSIEQPPMIKKMASLMCDSSYNKNFGISLKSPQSFSSSHKGNSLGHSGSTPRFRGDSLIFKKKSYVSLLPAEKNNENNGDLFFQEKSSNNLKPKTKKSIDKLLGELEEVRNESKEEEA